MASANINLKVIIHRIPRQLDHLYFNYKTLNEIKNISRKLSNNGSSGINNISNKLVKNLIKLLIVPLYIILKLLIEGIFLDTVKTAGVIPLYKSKERYPLNNYRPITLLFTLSKCLEK